MNLGYVSGGSGGAGVAPGGGVGGQYMAMVPPQQPPTPTSHAPPQLFTTFFRPSVQVGTPLCMGLVWDQDRYDFFYIYRYKCMFSIG